MRDFNSKMPYVHISKNIVALAALCCGPAARPQAAELSYTSELQTGFSDKSNWVNLLQLGASVRISDKWSARIATISTGTTNNGHIIPDMLTYSNIEEENIPIALSRLGVNFTHGRWAVSAGIGNVNDAFFATTLTSLFTNSSCGIFPTVSCNFGIANFPDASMGIEGRYEYGGITINSSIYNGKGCHGFTGSDCVFGVRPSSDGVFNINSINCQRHGSNYNLGIGVYHGPRGIDSNGAQEFLSPEAPAAKTTALFYWLYAEQKIGGGLGIMAQYSQCPILEYGCRNFVGGGVVYSYGRCDFGIYTCYADFTDAFEWASELTLKYELSSHIYVQPAVHYIKNPMEHGFVGLLRLGVDIDF